MLASLCIEKINILFLKSVTISLLDDEQLIRTWQQIYHYFRLADSSTIQRIVDNYIFRNQIEPVTMMPLQIRLGNLKFGLKKTTVQQILEFLRSIKKDVATIVEVHCYFCMKGIPRQISLFSNLKVLQLDDCRSDDELRCVSQECPLLEKVTCLYGVTDIGLEYLGDLTKLKDLNVSGQHSITAAGIISFFEKSRTVLELFEFSSVHILYDAVNDLASQNEVIPSMKYFECRLSDLANVLKVFPFIKSLIVNTNKISINDFIKLQHDFNFKLENNQIVKQLKISGCFKTSDAYRLLRLLNVILPQITSIFFDLKLKGQVPNDSLFSAATSFFWFATHLQFGCYISTCLLRTCMYPGNNVKFLKVRNGELFKDDDLRPYLRHLTELEEIYLNFYNEKVDCEYINLIVKLLPNLRVIRIDLFCIYPKELIRMRFMCSSNNRYGIQFLSV